MSDPLHTVVETPAYLGDAARIGMTEAERKATVDQLALDPSCGVEVRGSGGVRKVRVAGRGKGDGANFTAVEIAQMKIVTTNIKRARKGTRIS